MTVDEYLSTKSLTYREFAKMIGGVSISTISRLRSGKQMPSYALARRIAEATGDAVTAADFAATAPERGERKRLATLAAGAE